MINALLTAHDNTVHLVDELKTLHSNIRRYHQQLNEYATVNDILKGHFDEYKNLIMDKIYHPLKTMDSVPRFKAPIQKILNSWLANYPLRERMADQAVLRGKYKDKDEAEEEVTIKIGDILDMYEKLDGMLEEIDRKNAAYTRASVEKMQYLLNTDRSIKGKLVELLTRCTPENAQRENTISRLSEMICLYSQGYAEEKIRKYLNQSPSMENLTDDEALCGVGIVKAPELFDFCGNMMIKLQNKAIDFSPLIYGTTINSKTASEMEITGLNSVNRVLFIENKANYLDYISRNKKLDELVIYHGGFYSPVKGSFFQKLYQAGKAERTKFFHWSDIDLGGFHIFVRLRDNIIPELQPYFMDEKAFISIKLKGMEFEFKYASLLEELLGKPEYKIFHPVIKLMLKDRIRIEQEAFI